MFVYLFNVAETRVSVVYYVEVSLISHILSPPILSGAPAAAAMVGMETAAVRSA